MSAPEPDADDDRPRASDPGAPTPVVGLVMVYDADGGVRGELAYAWGKLRGTAHCALCSITHGLVNERRSWARWRSKMPVATTVVHRDERTTDVVAITGDRTPCVLAQVDDGLVYLLGPGELDACDGDLDVFERVLAAALERADLALAVHA